MLFFGAAIQADFVAAGFLGCIKSLVGCENQFLDTIVAGSRVAGNPERNGEFNHLPLLQRNLDVINRCPQPLGCFQRIFSIGFRQKDDKFFAAETRGEINIAQHQQKNTGQLLEDNISRLVPVGVVHLLEEINVHHQQREFAPIAFRARQLLFRPEHEGAPVGQPGEGIRAGQMLKLLLPGDAFDFAPADKIVGTDPGQAQQPDDPMADREIADVLRFGIK